MKSDTQFQAALSRIPKYQKPSGAPVTLDPATRPEWCDAIAALLARGPGSIARNKGDLYNATYTVDGHRHELTVTGNFMLLDEAHITATVNGFAPDAHVCSNPRQPDDSTIDCEVTYIWSTAPPKPKARDVWWRKNGVPIG